MQVSIVIPREVSIFFSEEKRDLLKKVVDPKEVMVYPTSMPDQRHADKVKLNAWVSRAFFRRVQKLAEQRNENVTDTVIAILTIATQKIQLTAEDYDQIAKETREAQQSNKA